MNDIKSEIVIRLSIPALNHFKIRELTLHWLVTMALPCLLA